MDWQGQNIVSLDPYDKHASQGGNKTHMVSHVVEGHFYHICFFYNRLEGHHDVFIILSQYFYSTLNEIN